MANRESAGSCPNEKSWLLARLLDMSQFSFPEWLKEKWGPHKKKDLAIPQQVDSVVILPVPPKWSKAFTQVNIQGKMGTCKDWWTQSVSWFWFPMTQSTTVPSIPFKECGVQSWLRSNSLWVTGSIDPFSDYFSIPKYIIGMGIHGKWQNSHIRFLIFGIRATVMGKAKQTHLKCPHCPHPR